jgi:hypothetical protein
MEGRQHHPEQEQFEVGTQLRVAATTAQVAVVVEEEDLEQPVRGQLHPVLELPARLLMGLRWCPGALLPMLVTISAAFLDLAV